MLFCLLVLVCASYAAAAVDGVVKVPLTVNRTSVYEFNLTSHGPADFYWVDIEVGSPHQVISVLVDTGSSDLVFPTGYYDPSASSTSKDLGFTFWDWSTSYEVYSDTVTLGELTLKNFTLGVGGKTGETVLGIGPKVSEAVWSESQLYENFPLALRDSGYIKSAAFSFFLETSGSVTQAGSILFGGIDHAKYAGELVAYPYTTADNYIYVDVKGIRFADGSWHPLNTPVVIDTGTPSMVLPDAYLAEIKSVFGPTYANGTIINYKDSWKSTLFSVDFGNQVITIPYYDFLVPDGAGGYKIQYLFSSETEVGKNLSIFGDTFIRNAYTVFNYDAETLSFAQINYNANGASNISVI